MEKHVTLLLPAGGDSQGQRSWTGLPADLLNQARARLRVLALLYAFVFFMAGIFPMLVISSDRALLFSGFVQWGPAFISIGLALLVAGVIQSRRVSLQAAMTIGLVFQVASSYGIAMAEFAAPQIPADGTQLIVMKGISWVAVWTLLFTIVVPSPPRRALLAALASVSAAPVTILVLMQLRLTPFRLDPLQFFFWLVLPYLLVVCMAYVGARVVYNLGSEVKRARELGSYHLEEKLGQGGMGEVWRARHTLLARPAAIKLMRPSVRGKDGQAAVSEDLLKRFEREAQVIASLRSPHTVNLFDFGVAQNGSFYYVMELLEGLDTDRLIRRFGPLPAERVIHVVRQVCHSLSEAESHGLVHRDIKPANIFLCRYGEEFDFVKVLDFGIVKASQDAPEAAGGEALTGENVVQGTPAFMAPEQVLSNAVDGRTDIYATGCVAYWLLTGQTVFNAPTPIGHLMHHTQTLPAAPSSRTELPIPPALDELVLACLAKDPADRPQSARELSRRLARVEGADRWGEERAKAWWERVGPLAGLTFLLLNSGCAKDPAPPRAEAAPNLGVPAWTADAIWYQVFVERFRNGDPSNDPTAHDIVGVTDETPPAGWQTTPWTNDWYRQDDWEKKTGRDFYGTVQFRRYGGDLRGVIERLDYLQNLGVTALYLNPVNDAPSLHKYDARTYQHIDRNFGPDPRGDETRITAEDPVNPATWQWTAADSLFLALVREVHRRGMRIIMDYSWNHTGITFWAWQDVLAKQQKSRFADWYEIENFDDPATPDTNEFRYRGWVGVPWLPEWKKVGRPEGQHHGAIEGNLVPGVRDLVFNVTRRWLDPNGDGDPSDGVDGFRLDVAEMVPLGFWRDYRRFVRGINPEAYLVGEIWWETWPDKVYHPAPWANDDVFDAVMHYRWYDPTRRFFAGAPPALTPSAYAAALDSLGSGITPAHQRAMMNLTASHDTPRFSTSVYNPGRYKYQNTPREDSTYRIDRPDDRTRRIQRQILVQQFTWTGGPHIWNGDEVGMWGADDPDERKPMVWADQQYQDEATHPFGRPRRRDRVAPDTSLLRTYQELIALRRQHPRLFAEGEVRWLLRDDATGMLAYERVLGNEQAIVASNASDAAHPLSLAVEGFWRQAWPAGDSSSAAGATLQAVMPARGATVWIRE